MYCIVLYCIALHCIVLYCIVLYCIVLYALREQFTFSGMILPSSVTELVFCSSHVIYSKWRFAVQVRFKEIQRFALHFTLCFRFFLYLCTALTHPNIWVNFQLPSFSTGIENAYIRETCRLFNVFLVCETCNSWNP